MASREGYSLLPFIMMGGAVLHPHLPKLNSSVERAQRTHMEEFYEVTNFSLEMAALNQDLLAWEHTYNTIRPHQALAYLTPHQFVTQWQHQRWAS